MKTGYTENAGYCLITSARRGERRLISVVLGAASEAARAAESQKLLNYGFQFYDSVKLYEKNQPVASLQVWKGSGNSVKAGFLADLYVSLPKGQADKLKATLESQQPLLAPVGAGQKIGVMKLTLDGKPYAEIPVVALGDVAARRHFRARLGHDPAVVQIVERAGRYMATRHRLSQRRIHAAR